MSCFLYIKPIQEHVFGKLFKVTDRHLGRTGVKNIIFY